jgi:hypothetical protein
MTAQSPATQLDIERAQIVIAEDRKVNHFAGTVARNHRSKVSLLTRAPSSAMI